MGTATERQDGNGAAYGKTIVERNPKELRPHPVLDSMPMLEEDAAEYQTMMLSISERGVDVPLLIDAQNRIYDGRHRWKIANDLSLATVPCEVIEADQALTIAVDSLFARKHYTISARAYLVVPHVEGLLAEARRRRVGNLIQFQKGQKKNRKTQNPQCSSEVLVSAGSVAGDAERVTSETLASRFGFGRKYLDFARRIREQFAKDAGLRAEFEPKILNGDLTLGAYFAGLAGRAATKGQPKRAHQLTFDDWLSKSPIPFGRLESASKPQRLKAAQQIADSFIPVLPKDVLKILARRFADAAA